MAHITGRTYVIAWVGLLVLTALSFATSVVKPSLIVETGIALGIATVKAIWVALVFMHLLESRFANRVTIGVAFALVATLAALMLGDVLLRHTMPPRPLDSADVSALAPSIGPAKRDEAEHQRADDQRTAHADEPEHVHPVPTGRGVETKAPQQHLVRGVADSPL